MLLRGSYNWGIIVCLHLWMHLFSSIIINVLTLRLWTCPKKGQTSGHLRHLADKSTCHKCLYCKTDCAGSCFLWMLYFIFKLQRFLQCHQKHFHLANIYSWSSLICLQNKPLIFKWCLVGCFLSQVTLQRLSLVTPFAVLAVPNHTGRKAWYVSELQTQKTQNASVSLAGSLKLWKD